jgi:uncharacterized membrane protein
MNELSTLGGAAEPRQTETSAHRLQLPQAWNPAGLEPPSADGGTKMLLTLALILFVAWLLGLVGVYTIGSIVHVLLVIAIVLFIVGLISGRRTVV